MVPAEKVKPKKNIILEPVNTAADKNVTNNAERIISFASLSIFISTPLSWFICKLAHNFEKSTFNGNLRTHLAVFKLNYSISIKPSLIDFIRFVLILLVDWNFKKKPTHVSLSALL